jgi:hypothetical protein
LERIQNGFVGAYAAELLVFIFKISESMLEPSVRLYIYDSVCLQVSVLSRLCLLIV